jgi:hypothetical protein
MDEFVGHDTHFLDGKGLHARPWEAFNDPAFFRLLGGLDLFGHAVNHNIIIDTLIVEQALLDALTVGRGFLGLVSEAVTSLNELPLEVLSEPFGEIVALAAGRSHEEHSVNCKQSVKRKNTYLCWPF